MYKWLIRIDVSDWTGTVRSLIPMLRGAGFLLEHVSTDRMVLTYDLQHVSKHAMTKFVLQCPKDVKPYEYEEVL